MDTGRVFETLMIALGLGLLVGTQRERVDAPHAGVRTFALITLLGAVAGLLAPAYGAWVVGAGLVAVALATLTGNLVVSRERHGDGGITTEVAILVMYLVGAYLVVGFRPVAVATGAGVAVLLHAKPVLRGFVKRLGDTEMRVMMQFVLISLVILPVLPDRAFGPYAVLNPREVWWMVVLVVAISLAGWLSLKLYGDRAGLVLAGLIGGLVSSTASTVSFARRAGGAPAAVPAATLLVMLSTTVVQVRVLAEVLVVAPGLFPSLAPPLAVMLLTSAALCVLPWRRTRDESVDLPPHENPAELRPAIVFGLLYALVLILVAAARQHLGEPGVYAAAALSGLTDMDAITLGSARMGARGVFDARLVLHAILVASLANLAFKAAVVHVLGGPALGRRVALLFSGLFAVGIALLLWWPV